MFKSGIKMETNKEKDRNPDKGFQQNGEAMKQAKGIFEVTPVIDYATNDALEVKA